MTNFVKQFKAARRVSTPLIAVRTPDQAMTTQAIKDAVTNGETPAILVWDCVRGCLWRNPEALAVCWRNIANKPATVPIPSDATEQEKFRVELGRLTMNIVTMLEAAVKLPANTVLICMNMQMQWDKGPTIQAAWNLRDLFKADGRTLVMLTDPNATVPTGLRDALPIDEKLPTSAELATIVKEQMGAAEMDDDPAKCSAAVDAVCGLSAFSAEQAVALSFVRRSNKIDLDMEGLWERKRTLVRQTPGLSIYGGKERFDDLGGLGNIKEFMRSVLSGARPPKAILFTDEIEKQVGGGDSDLSGMQQMQIGKLLTWSQEKAPDGHQKVSGVLCVGHPGAGKSAVAKALGNEAGVPCIVADLGDTKNSLVGASEERMTGMLNVVDAVGQGSILWIATCNGVDRMKPEFLSRFSLAQFFFDLPDADEREAIWQVYLRKYALDPKQQRPNDEGWVGREIEACCYKAWMLRLTLMEVASYMVINSIASADRIESLRASVNGRYLSATYEGLYRRDQTAKPVASGKKTRRISVE